MIIFVPLAVCIIGLLMYGFCTNPKLAEVGKIAFAFGLLVSLLQVAGKSATFLR